MSTRLVVVSTLRKLSGKWSPTVLTTSRSVKPRYQAEHTCPRLGLRVQINKNQRAYSPAVNAIASTLRSPLSRAATCCFSTNRPTTSTSKPSPASKTHFLSFQDAPWSSPTIGGSLTGLPHTFSPTKAPRKIRHTGTGSRETLRPMKPTRLNDSARTRQGGGKTARFGISETHSRLTGENLCAYTYPSHCGGATLTPTDTSTTCAYSACWKKLASPHSGPPMTGCHGTPVTPPPF